MSDADHCANPPELAFVTTCRIQNVLSLTFFTLAHEAMGSRYAY